MYCAYEDIVPSKLSEAKISELTSDVAYEIDDDVIAGAIGLADREIDSYCGKHYSVPFDPIPDRIRMLSAQMVPYKLCERRINETGGEIAKSYRDMYMDAISFLKDVAAGKAVLDAAIQPAPSIKNAGGSFHSNKKIFSDKNLKNL